MENTLIRLEDADILNGEATVIYGLDLEVKAADFVYITGKVGRGKTCIIKTLIGETVCKRAKVKSAGSD